MIVKSADHLLTLSKQMLMAAGANERNATRAAEALISSSLCGVDTHGIQHLPSNVAWLRSGEIVGTARPEVTKESPSSALVKGNWTFGHVTAKVVMDVAIAKAEQQGIAIVGAGNGRGTPKRESATTMSPAAAAEQTAVTPYMSGLL